MICVLNEIPRFVPQLYTSFNDFREQSINKHYKLKSNVNTKNDGNT